MHTVMVVGRVLVVGIGLAFTPVFAVIFGGNPEQTGYGSLLLVAGAYLICAGITGLLTRSWKVAFWLTPPAILVLMGYSAIDTSGTRFHLAVLLALAVGTAVGAVTGSWLRGPKRQRAPSSP